MQRLPKSSVAKLDQLVSASAWRAANERWKCKDDAERDAKDISIHNGDLSKMFAELGLDQNVLAAVCDIANFCGWQAANERYGYHEDAQRDNSQASQALSKLIATGKVTQQLATQIYELAQAHSWHAANSRAKYLEDAEADKAKAAKCLKDITTLFP